MNAAEIQIIKRTQPQFNVDMFYDRLFKRSPETKQYFTGIDMIDQKRKVFAALALIAKSCDDLPKLVPHLQRLGRIHAGYGIPANLYPAVGEALVYALQLSDPHDVSAWTNAYDVVATVMIEAGKEVKKA
jgi:hemoglobin-like flavoprotein